MPKKSAFSSFFLREKRTFNRRPRRAPFSPLYTFSPGIVIIGHEQVCSSFRINRNSAQGVYFLQSLTSFWLTLKEKAFLKKTLVFLFLPKKTTYDLRQVYSYTRTVGAVSSSPSAASKNEERGRGERRVRERSIVMLFRPPSLDDPVIAPLGGMSRRRNRKYVRKRRRRRRRRRPTHGGRTRRVEMRNSS